MGGAIPANHNPFHREQAMNIHLYGLATANPPRYVSQAEAFEFYYHHLDPADPSRELYRRLLEESPIQGRYIAVDADEQALETDPDQLIGRYLKFARSIATTAADRAMLRAGVMPGELAGMVTNSCTGYICPALSSYLAEELGLPPFIKFFDLMGMGCGGAIPNLELAAGMASAGPMLSLAAEICSATVFNGPEPDLVVSNAIFGDGAGAAILGPPTRSKKPLLGFVDFESGLFCQYREQLRYRTQEGKLRNVLSKRVPVIGAETVCQVAKRLLARNGLGVGDIAHWAVHAGGTAVLRQVEKKLGLSAEQLRFSHQVFVEYGNMSSPTVLFVLEKILKSKQPIPGEKGLLLSFGAGFSAFGALVTFW